MFVLGVTGNSGSGKSTVCEILNKKGAYIINADALARKVLEKGGLAYDEVTGYYGPSILLDNGQINRKALSDIVFSDEEKLKALNSMTHKHVIDDMSIEIKNAESAGNYKFICLDVPLLFESGTDAICDLVWLVDAPYEYKLNRIIDRDKISAEQASKRLAQQTDSGKLKELAEDVIFNSGDLFDLEKQVCQKLARLNEEGLLTEA